MAIEPMSGINLKRVSPPKGFISLVPLVDVMLILLVFFMVTSTYLNLDMLPAIERTDETLAESQALPGNSKSTPLLIRLGSDGQPAVRGQTLSLAELSARIRIRLADAPLTAVVVLPSAAAKMQALISVMDAATHAGATRLSVIRLEARR